jgi:hypothetical protein
MVGLSVLGGALAAPAHPIIAGLVLGVGASIKVIGFLPLGAITLWAWYRRGFRHAATLLGSGLTLVVIGYVLAGGSDALQPLGRGSRLVVRHTFWFYPRQWIAAGLQATGLTRTRALDGTAHQIAIMGTGVVLFVALIVVLARFRRQRPEELAGASLVPYLFGAPYVLPWYSGWLLPTFATSRKTLLARLVALQAILVFAVDPDRLFHVHGFSGDIEHTVQRYGLPLFELVVMISLVVSGIRQLVRWKRAPTPAVSTPAAEDQATSAVQG